MTNKLLVSNVMFRFRNMSDTDKAHMIVIAFKNPDWMRKNYPEVFKNIDGK